MGQVVLCIIFEKKWLKSPYFSLSDFNMGKGGAAELGGIGLKPWHPLIFLKTATLGNPKIFGISKDVLF